MLIEAWTVRFGRKKGLTLDFDRAIGVLVKPYREGIRLLSVVIRDCDTVKLGGQGM